MERMALMEGNPSEGEVEEGLSYGEISIGSYPWMKPEHIERNREARRIMKAAI